METDPTKLEQGTDFIAEVTVINPGSLVKYDNMALTQIFPSGWEFTIRAWMARLYQELHPRLRIRLFVMTV